MSFELIPADLLLKIFHELPFKDRVHLSGVSRSFRNASEESIAKMKSLVIDEDVIEYATRIQTFSSLLESCSPTLQFIDVSDRSCGRSFFSVLAEFVYPKLEHLEATVDHFNKDQVKRLISRIPNLRSIDLRLDRQFEWPKDIVYEMMEKLEIRVYRPDVDLSPTLRPLIGKTPNLKHLIIYVAESRCTLSAIEITQLLASTPYLEALDLDLAKDTVNMCLDLSTWRLPKLITLEIELKCPNASSILRHFPASFPRLESFSSFWMKEIDDQAIMALSQLKHLKKLWLPNLEMTNKMVSAFRTITVLGIKRIDDQVLDSGLQSLSQLERLRELRIKNTDNMMKGQIIDLITNVPPLATLEIDEILGVGSPEALIEFLTSTATVFLRDLEIRPCLMRVDGIELEFEDVLDEIKNNGGPEVSYKRDEEDENSLRINSIRYKSLAG